MQSIIDFFKGGNPSGQGGPGAILGADAQKKFFSVSGKASFQVQVQVAGNQPYSSCVLSVLSVNAHNNSLVIASRCEWSRCFFAKEVPIMAHGNTYRVSALDIGAMIRVRVTPLEPDEMGEAYVTFGPIRVDESQKALLRTAIKSGGMQFEFDSISPFDTDEGTHAGKITIFENYVKFTMHNWADREFRMFFGDQYWLAQGKDDQSVEIQFADAFKKKNIIEFFKLNPETPGLNGCLKVRMVSQNTRDDLVVVLRAFAHIADVKDKIIVEKTLEQIPKTDNGDQGGNLPINPGIMVSIDDVSTQLDDTLLRRELKLLDKTNRQAVGQQKKLSFMVNKLDGEISRTHYCRDEE